MAFKLPYQYIAELPRRAVEQLQRNFSELERTLNRRVGCEVRRANTQTLTNIALVTISWDTEDEDTDGFITPHATTGTTFTIPEGLGGVYAISTELNSISNPLNSAARLEIHAGNYVFSYPGDDITAPTRLAASACLPLAAGQTVQVKAYNDDGSNPTCLGSCRLYRVSP